MNATHDREQRIRQAYFTTLQRQLRERYCIEFNCKGSFNPVTQRYNRYVWPVLFHSEELALRALRALPWSQNFAANEHRGRLYSVSVRKVTLK